MTHKSDTRKSAAQIVDHLDNRPGGHGGPVHMVTCSSISVTRAAIGERSERVSVT